MLVDAYADELCIFRCIEVHQGAHPVCNTKRTREFATSFFDKRRVRQIYNGHFPLIENHFQRRIVGYEVDTERRFALKYLPRALKIGVPQMNIGIYEEHAFLITNLDKVTRNYAFAECQARFTQACNLRRHAEVCTRGETEVVCRGERIQPPENAYDKAFYAQEAYAERAVSWMEHDAQWTGLHIYYQMCGHGTERRRAGHQVDGFCTETNTLFQFHACL